MAYRGEAAIKRGHDDKTNEVGMCLREVRGWFGVDAKYASAISAWRNAAHRHSGGHRGLPCFWSGGSKDFGHIALDIGNGYCISTDAPGIGSGKVGVVKKSAISSAWYMTYLGYTTDLNGVSLWVPTVDLSKIRYTASGHPTFYPYGTKRVETVLHRHGLLAAKYVNNYWASGATGDAWKRLCRELGVTESRIPTNYTLKALARTGGGRLIVVP